MPRTEYKHLALYKITVTQIQNQSNASRLTKIHKVFHTFLSQKISQCFLRMISMFVKTLAFPLYRQTVLKIC